MVGDIRSSTATVRVVSPVRQATFLFMKRCVQLGFSVVILPRLLSYAVARTLIGKRAITSSAESIARVPGLRGVFLRQAFYRRILCKCGRDVYLGWGTVFSMTEACVGERAYIGRYCSIGFAAIGEDAMLADGVQILSGGHEHDQDRNDKALSQQGQTYHQVRIGTDVWIGAGAIIMADVGDHAVIGAGAVVNRPIPAGAVAVGVPARVVKWREGWPRVGCGIDARPSNVAAS